VSLIGGTDTLYVCSFTTILIISVVGLKSFAMEKGTLELGGGTSYSFSWVADGGALRLSEVEIKFVSPLNRTIHVIGGTITLEHVQMHDQLDTNWVAALVNGSATSAPIIVHIVSCTIANCKYKHGSSIVSSYQASPVVCLNKAAYSITLNISSTSFLNNTFHLNAINDGGACMFYSGNSG
jgi:hypothetical protein